MQVIEVAIGPGSSPGSFRVEVLSSPAGEAVETVAVNMGSLLTVRERLQQAVLASAVASRRLVNTTEMPVREAGRQLFTAPLGTGEVAGVYRASAALASERGQGLRLELRVDDPVLAGLPWEAMYDEGKRIDPSEGRTFTEGSLFLGIDDSVLSDNTGAFDVTAVLAEK